MNRILITALCVLLAACQSRLPPSPMLAPQAYAPLAQTELVTLQAGEHEAGFTARLEGDASLLRVVAITPTGQRLFTLTRYPDRLDAEPGPLWPREMPLLAIWSDIELSHAPQDAQLPAGWQRQPQADGYDWYYRGQLQAQVRQQDGRTLLIRPDYRLTLEILPDESP